MEKKLTKLQTYNAMIRFLDRYYGQAKSDDLGLLLDSMSFLSDDFPADMAMWEDWNDSIKIILNKKKENTLTKLQAYNSMRNFLENYCERINSEDIKVLLGYMEISSNGRTVHSYVWQAWTESINESLKENKNYYLSFM